MGVLSEGRPTLGIGAGENLNGHVTRAPGRWHGHGTSRPARTSIGTPLLPGGG
jgi:hypothetical protein